ncbi:MAG: hypothetical protein KJI71_01395 [Patescibacteria group bacterium]|nr:hypothetical protein [Patescibacteria group bacterium]
MSDPKETQNEELDDYLTELEENAEPEASTAEEKKPSKPVKRIPKEASEVNDANLDTLLEEYKVLKNESLIIDTYKRVKKLKEKEHSNLHERVLKTLVMAGVRGELDKEKSSEKVKFLVMGKGKQYGKKSKKWIGSIWGLCFNPKKSQEFAPMKLTKSVASKEGLDFIDRADHYNLYEIFITKGSEIKWNVGYSEPNLIWMGDSTNFNNKKRGAGKDATVINMFKKYYNLAPMTKVEAEEGMETISCGLSQMTEPNDEGISYAKNDDFKMLIVVPQDQPRTLANGSVTITAYPLEDDTEKISIWAYDDPVFTNWDHKVHALAIVGAISKSKTEDYGKFSMNAIAIQPVPLNLIHKFYQ